MESQIVEKTRALEADIERHRDEIVFEQMVATKHQRHELLREHYVAKRISLIQKKAERLQELYEDDEDLQELCGAEVNTGADGAAIKEAVDSILYHHGSLREYHRTTGIQASLNLTKEGAIAGTIQAAEEHDDLAVMGPVVEALFASSEYFGKVVDLHPFHRLYSELISRENKRRLEAALAAGQVAGAVTIPQLDYKDYISKIMETFKAFSTEQKVDSGDAQFWTLYKNYVFSLRDYLKDFHSRQIPLGAAMQKSTLNSAEKRVKDNWAKGGVKNWQTDVRHKKTDSLEVATAEEQVKDIVENLLPDTITATKDFAGRIIGRNAEELLRAQEEDQTSFTKSLQAGKKAKQETRNTLRGGKDASGAIVGIKAAGSGDVATADDYDISKFGQNDGNDNDGGLDGNNNLMAYDATEDLLLDDEGKPLPLYLVKLHGLLNSYLCEICGGEAYKGPKDYHEHFYKERHSTGLKNLGIDNKKIYDGVAEIREALAIKNLSEEDFFSKRLREDADEEEIEDAQGNVITAKRHKEMHRGLA